MHSKQIIKSVIFMTAMSMCSQAVAEVYKCTSYDSQGNKQGIAYTDQPCVGRVVQTSIALQTSPSNTAAELGETSLDAKITQAVLMQDFALAKSLARTKAHWRLISLTEGARHASARTSPVVSEQAVARDECAIARNAYESTARRHWRDDKRIAIKKNSMFAACGSAESAPGNTVVAGYQPGGIYSSRWLALPYAPAVYHQPYYKQHHKHHPYHANRGGSLSISYQSKHVNVRAQSGGVQKHTDIRQQFRTHNFAAEQHSDLRQQFR